MESLPGQSIFRKLFPLIVSFTGFFLIFFFLSLNWNKPDKVLPKVVIDLHSTNLTFKSIEVYHKNAMNHAFFKDKTIKLRAIFPIGYAPESVPSPITMEIFNATKTDDLSKLDDLAAKSFLKLFPDTPWYYHGIDDTWVDPGNLMQFIGQLERIVNPYKHVVIKSLSDPVYPRANFVVGGIGWLISRAALERLFEIGVSLTYVNDFSYQEQDRHAMTMILWRIFPRREDWSFERFFNYEWDRVLKNQHLIPRLVNQLTSLSLLPTCPRNNVPLVPLNQFITINTRGIPEFQEFARKIPTFDSKYYMAINSSRNTIVCEDDPKRGKELLSLRNLAKRTPVIKKKDLKNPLFTEKDKMCKIRATKQSIEEANKFCRFYNQEAKYYYRNDIK